ncbi:hypothetical protein ACNJYD_09100 [Bradyrhizobium sp. DASA03005]|uniref:hypothetical protein n=1 Tax=Bradyrhizobium sp. SPXBL-02 TaxID=3395912 RepID=UPI003F711EE4
MTQKKLMPELDDSAQRTQVVQSWSSVFTRLSATAIPFVYYSIGLTDEGFHIKTFANQLAYVMPSETNQHFARSLGASVLGQRPY